MMKDRYPKFVEEGRILRGDFATDPGSRCGAFSLRRGGTGRVFYVIASNGGGWDHVSVSTSKRCPTLDEMCWVKGLFFGPEEEVVQYHPRASEYVNCHPHCLHLWRPQHGEIVRPPTSLIATR